MLLENDRYYVGMDALVTVCSWNTGVIMLLAWMLDRMFLEHENVIMLWAWMPR